MMVRRTSRHWLTATGLWFALLWTAQVAAQRASQFGIDVHVLRGDSNLVHVIDTEWSAAARALQFEPQSDPTAATAAAATPQIPFSTGQLAIRIITESNGRQTFARPGIRAPPLLYTSA